MKIDNMEIKRYARFYGVQESEVSRNIGTYRDSYFLDMLLHPNNFHNVRKVFSDVRQSKTKVL